MDIRTGVVENTQAMEAEFFGLDEALWLVEDHHGAKNPSASFQENMGTEFTLDEPSMDFASTFESPSLAFDNDWMTTKIDFDSLGDLTDVIVGELQQPESIDGGDGGPLKAGGQPQQNDTSLKTNSTPSPQVAPTSPEQNVPNTELTLESTAHMNNFINAVFSGRITMDFPDLPCSNTYNPTQKTSAISENLELSEEILNPSSFKNITKSKSFQDLQDSLFSDENSKQGFVDSSDSVCEVATSPVSVKKLVEASAPRFRHKTKQKTPEQKQRKQLQNRNAATRYRCKKRKEQEVLNDECEKLEQENKKLRTKIENLQQETKYLKNLIVDIYDKKPLKIKQSTAKQ